MCNITGDHRKHKLYKFQYLNYTCATGTQSLVRSNSTDNRPSPNDTTKYRHTKVHTICHFLPSRCSFPIHNTPQYYLTPPTDECTRSASPRHRSFQPSRPRAATNHSHSALGSFPLQDIRALEPRAVDDLVVDGKLASSVIDDHDAHASSSIGERFIKVSPEGALVDDGKVLLYIASLGHGNDVAIITDVEDAVLLEDRPEHVLDDD